MTRSEFLSPLVGRPWEWRGGNCWDFAAHVQRELFGRILPYVDVPSEPSWRWMVDTVAAHPERQEWREVACGPHGLVMADDGALVLMGRLNHPGHIGVWLRPENAVIHCDRKDGVCLQCVSTLLAVGWRKLRFYEPLT